MSSYPIPVLKKLGHNMQGRVDVYVQSTDKNFMVPVGGSVVAGPDKYTTVADVCQNYPGITARGHAESYKP